MTNDYTYRNCCCYQCSAMTPHSTPDCACETGPLFDPEQCEACPKGNWCDVPANPQFYPPLNEL